MYIYIYIYKGGLLHKKVMLNKKELGCYAIYITYTYKDIYLYIYKKYIYNIYRHVHTHTHTHTHI